MRELQKEREAVARLVAQALGDDPKQPRVFAGHLRSVGLEADILALPVARSSEMAIQIFDPADPSFGALRFLAGVSRLDGDDVLI